MTRYLARKIVIYLVTFWVAVTIDWAIPRFMPGDPIERLISRMQAQPSSRSTRSAATTPKAFGFDVPLWKQYLNFWAALFHGDLGRSVANFPTPVSELILGALPYTLALLVPGDPAQLLGRQQGRRDGRAAQGARQHACCRSSYAAHRDAADVARDRARWVFATTSRAGFRSRARTTSRSSRRGRSSSRGASSSTGSCRSSALFLVAFGGWAIGMRNMIIYELEADYSNYLAALGAPHEARPQVRLPQRAAAADHGPRARARRGRRRARSWSRSSSRIPASARSR